MGQSYSPGYAQGIYLSSLLPSMSQLLSQKSWETRLPSEYQVHLQQTLCILGIAQCCIGTYHAVVQYHLVLLYTCTYHLVQPVTIQETPSFQNGTQYVQICTALITLCTWCVLVHTRKNKNIECS
jgi:hypothetical protein